MKTRNSWHAVSARPTSSGHSLPGSMPSSYQTRNRRIGEPADDREHVPHVAVRVAREQVGFRAPVGRERRLERGARVHDQAAQERRALRSRRAGRGPWERRVAGRGAVTSSSCGTEPPSLARRTLRRAVGVCRLSGAAFGACRACVGRGLASVAAAHGALARGGLAARGLALRSLARGTCVGRVPSGGGGRAPARSACRGRAPCAARRASPAAVAFASLGAARGACGELPSCGAACAGGRLRRRSPSSRGRLAATAHGGACGVVARRFSGAAGALAALAVRLRGRLAGLRRRAPARGALARRSASAAGPSVARRPALRGRLPSGGPCAAAVPSSRSWSGCFLFRHVLNPLP